MNKTFSAKAGQVKQDWFVVDASGKILGRLASEIALRLRASTKRFIRRMSIPAILL